MESGRSRRPAAPGDVSAVILALPVVAFVIIKLFEGSPDGHRASDDVSESIAKTGGTILVGRGVAARSQPAKDRMHTKSGLSVMHNVVSPKGEQNIAGLAPNKRRARAAYTAALQGTKAVFTVTIPKPKDSLLSGVFRFEELPAKVKRGRRVGKKMVASFFGMTGYRSESAGQDNWLSIVVNARKIERSQRCRSGPAFRRDKSERCAPGSGERYPWERSLQLVTTADGRAPGPRAPPAPAGAPIAAVRTTRTSARSVDSLNIDHLIDRKLDQLNDLYSLERFERRDAAAAATATRRHFRRWRELVRKGVPRTTEIGIYSEITLRTEKPERGRLEWNGLHNPVQDRCRN
ncbi:hypothetical protein EVAR_29913_1 [Eumeta japonica]|uniref:Uncharacterized protein n=1 Tax=Eumeta variegata TaxID=151549 RepID=A0A4C1V7R2_EUMVA|nr:hypothetical protein EVAR_29913_1 [Eumeta japonica]